MTLLRTTLCDRCLDTKRHLWKSAVDRYRSRAWRNKASKPPDQKPIFHSAWCHGVSSAPRRAGKSHERESNGVPCDHCQHSFCERIQAFRPVRQRVCACDSVCLDWQISGVFRFVACPGDVGCTSRLPSRHPRMAVQHLKKRPRCSSQDNCPPPPSFQICAEADGAQLTDGGAR